MGTLYSTFSSAAYRILLLSLSAGLLGGCIRSQQLGMEDNPEEILEKKLNNPEAILTPSPSISLINYCTQLGEQNAAYVAEKTVSIFVGNTGAGKSTTLNALLGCQMKAVKPRELGLPGTKRIVIVDPESPREEVMPTGHSIRSQTFMPQIASDPDNPNKAYCDCPGFSDNRGAEINIANAINTRRVLQQARGVKAVFLTDYNGLLVDRGTLMKALEGMCHQMFGGIENLRRYQNSVLLGITKAPLYEDDELLTQNTVRELLTRFNSPIAQILADRIFLFDPLDRAMDNQDFWSLAHCRDQIDRLDSIPQHEATTLFQTILTDSDRTHLLDTIRQLKSKILHAITEGDITALSQHWQLLQRLQVIEHPEIEQLMEGEIVSPINTAILKRVDVVKNSANAFNFSDAQQRLNKLTSIVSHLPGVPLVCNIDEIQMHIRNCEANKDNQEAREKHIAALNKTVEEAHRRLKENKPRGWWRAVGTVVGAIVGGPAGAFVGDAAGTLVDLTIETIVGNGILPEELVEKLVEKLSVLEKISK